MHDLKVTDCILQIFAKASGLIKNLTKSECYPIRCNDMDLSFITANNLKLSSFQCCYLGLPLNIRKPTRAEVHAIVQKIGTDCQAGKEDFSLTLGENCW